MGCAEGKGRLGSMSGKNARVGMREKVVDRKWRRGIVEGEREREMDEGSGGEVESEAEKGKGGGRM